MATTATCIHCFKEFDRESAEMSRFLGDTFIRCPHCNRQYSYNMHPNCPYWRDGACGKGSGTYRCSLSSDFSYLTCHV